MNTKNIVQKGIVEAPIGVVLESLINKDALAKWWSVWSRCKVISYSVEAKVNGEFRIDSKSRSGISGFIAGKFLHVAKDLLSFTWQASSSVGFESTVIIKLDTKKNNATHVRIEHLEVYNETERAIIKRFWRRIISAMQLGIPRHFLPKKEDPSLTKYLRESRNKNKK